MKSLFDQLVEQLLNGNILMAEGVELLERRMIARALERSGGKQTSASRLLGIHRNTLQRKMIEYELGKGRRRARRRPMTRATGTPRRKTGAA
jgi:DNA-binding NtrC family response regulator